MHWPVVVEVGAAEAVDEVIIPEPVVAVVTAGWVDVLVVVVDASEVNTVLLEAAVETVTGLVVVRFAFLHDKQQLTSMDLPVEPTVNASEHLPRPAKKPPRERNQLLAQKLSQIRP